MEGLHPRGNGMEQDYGTACLSLSVLQKRALKPNGITSDGEPSLQSGTLLWSASKGLAGQVLQQSDRVRDRYYSSWKKHINKLIRGRMFSFSSF